MRVQLPAASRILACTTLLVLLYSAPTGTGISGAAVPLLMTTLLLATLAIVLATWCTRTQLVRGATAWRRAGQDVRTPARQCDPDAAGHVRPRAPDRSFVPLSV